MGSTDEPRSGHRPRGQRAALIGLGTALLLAMAVIVVGSSYQPFFHAPRHNPAGPDLPGPVVRPSAPSGPTALPTQPPDREQYHVIRYIVWTMFGVFALLLLVLVGLAVYRGLWPWLRTWIRRLRAMLHLTPSARPTDRAIPDVLDDVTEVVASQRESVRLGAPKGAIIDAWISLEQGAQDAGVPPRPSETSAELIIRIIDELDADSRALTRLGTLYRRARFSSHVIGEEDRTAAYEALASLEDSLRAAQERHRRTEEVDAP